MKVEQRGKVDRNLREDVESLVRLVGYNPGGGTTRAQFRDAIGDLRPTFGAFVEMSDQDDLAAVLLELGYGVIRPQGRVGQAATAVAYDRRQALMIAPFSIPLTPQGIRLGKGTGPDDGKAKYLTGSRFVLTESRRRCKVGVLHAYAGQKWPDHGQPNDRATISRNRIVKPARNAMDNGYGGVDLLGGDFNGEPDTPTTGPLRADGWRSNHGVLGELTTHVHHGKGGWSPDHWWMHDDHADPRDPRARFLSHMVVQPKGRDDDHRMLVVDTGFRFVRSRLPR